MAGRRRGEGGKSRKAEMLRVLASWRLCVEMSSQSVKSVKSAVQFLWLRPTFNHSILYQFSMLYDSVAPIMPFSANSDQFSAKSTQVIVHELFTR